MIKNNIGTFNLNAFVDIIPVSVDCAEDAGTQAGACLLILALPCVLLTPFTRRGPTLTLASEDSISKCLSLILLISQPVAPAVTRVVADLAGFRVSALSLPLVTVTTTIATTLGPSKKGPR